MKLKLTLDFIKRNHPKEYAKYCEEVRYYSQAIATYEKLGDEVSLYHASELALVSKRPSLAKDLATRALSKSRENLEISKSLAQNASNSEEGSGLMGAAISYWSAEERFIEMQYKVKGLLSKIQGAK